VIPPREDAEFAARMERLLALYAQEHDPRFPVVCLDEMPVGLLEHSREPLPAAPGRPRREDHEYERRGSATVFGAFCPKDGRRLLEVRPTRTARDLAHFLRRVLDEGWPGAERVVLVLDNLNTHTLGSLYKAFPPEEAWRLAARVELVHTPRHGSWLNTAELEFSVLRRQCLDRRIGSLEELARQIGAWQDERNRKRVRARWTFDAQTARKALAPVYPATGDDE
jgi:hypothetical protein